MQEKSASKQHGQSGVESQNRRDTPIEGPGVTDPDIDRPPTPPPYDGPKGGKGQSGHR